MRKILIMSLIALSIGCGDKGGNMPPGAGASTGDLGVPGAVPAPGATPAAPGAVAATPDKPEKKSVLDELKGAQLQEYYNPSGKRDPFKPFEGGEIVYSAAAKAPLERFELNQLELTAIVWGIARPKVLFRAPDGYSYIAQVGTGVGRNRGRITKITKNKVLIAEEFRDPSGQYVARESEFEMDSTGNTEKLFQEMQLKYSDE